MKKLILLSIIATCMPTGLFAQDDMYFVPTRELEEQTAREYGMPRDTYYIGSARSIDEYNRRGSYYEVLDSIGNDTINFEAGTGVYPDTLYVDEPEDYRYTSRLSRFDGYEPSSEFLAGYYAGRHSWYSPWYVNPFRSPWTYYDYAGYYYPWYSSWYDPWDPWYDPWYYGYYPGYYGYYGYYGYPRYYRNYYGAYYTPYYYTAYYSRPAGTHNHGHISHNSPGGIRNYGNAVSYSHGTFGGSRVGAGTFGRNTRNNGGTPSRGTYSTTPRRTTTNSYGRFGGARPNGSTTTTRTTPTTTTTPRTSTPSHSSGSFGGGSHSGGFGGGHSGGHGGGGGGRFGGRR